MREREFWELLEEVFGRTYGRSLSRDQRMPKLANMTVVEALDAGEEPCVVWNVLCDQMLCRFLSAETLQSLNSDGGQVKKALLSVVVGYATICVTIVKWLFLLAIRLTDGF